jgi:hypothetical protein
MNITIATLAAVFIAQYHTSANAAVIGSQLASAHNRSVLSQMHQWDNHIQDVGIAFDDTVVIIGNWPASYLDKNVAKTVAHGWCGEFDDDINYVQIHSLNQKILGTAYCK